MLQNDAEEANHKHASRDFPISGRPSLAEEQLAGLQHTKAGFKAFQTLTPEDEGMANRLGHNAKAHQPVLIQPSNKLSMT